MHKSGQGGRQTLASSISILALSSPSNIEESLLTRETLKNWHKSVIIQRQQAINNFSQRKGYRPELGSTALQGQGGLSQMQLQTSANKFILYNVNK